jgi:hypothetical protein
MTLKPLVALTVIHDTLELGKDGDEKKGLAPVAPKVRIVEPFSKTRVAFIASSEEAQASMLKVGAAALAPEGTPLDPEAALAGAAPIRKAAAAAASKPKAAATKPAEPAATGKADDGTGMV